MMFRHLMSLVIMSLYFSFVHSSQSFSDSSVFMNFNLSSDDSMEFDIRSDKISINHKESNKAEKLFKYLKKLKEVHVLSFVDLKSFLSSVNQNKIYNPLKCYEGMKSDFCSKPSSSWLSDIHSLEIEKFLKHKESLDLQLLQTLLIEEIHASEKIENDKEKKHKQ